MTGVSANPTSTIAPNTLSSSSPEVSSKSSNPRFQCKITHVSAENQVIPFELSCPLTSLSDRTVVQIYTVDADNNPVPSKYSLQFKREGDALQIILDRGDGSVTTLIGNKSDSSAEEMSFSLKYNNYQTPQQTVSNDQSNSNTYQEITEPKADQTANATQLDSHSKETIPDDEDTYSTIADTSYQPPSNTDSEPPALPPRNKESTVSLADQPQKSENKNTDSESIASPPSKKGKKSKKVSFAEDLKTPEKASSKHKEPSVTSQNKAKVDNSIETENPYEEVGPSISTEKDTIPESDSEESTPSETKTKKSFFKKIRSSKAFGALVRASGNHVSTLKDTDLSDVIAEAVPIEDSDKETKKKNKLKTAFNNIKKAGKKLKNRNKDGAVTLISHTMTSDYQLPAAGSKKEDVNSSTQKASSDNPKESTTQEDFSSHAYATVDLSKKTSNKPDKNAPPLPPRTAPAATSGEIPKAPPLPPIGNKAQTTQATSNTKTSSKRPARKAPPPPPRTSRVPTDNNNIPPAPPPPPPASFNSQVGSTTPNSSTHSKKTTDQGPIPQSLLKSIRDGKTLNKTKQTSSKQPTRKAAPPPPPRTSSVPTDNNHTTAPPATATAPAPSLKASAATSAKRRKAPILPPTAHTTQTHTQASNTKTSSPARKAVPPPPPPQSLKPKSTPSPQSLKPKSTPSPQSLEPKSTPSPKSKSKSTPPPPPPRTSSLPTDNTTVPPAPPPPPPASFNSQVGSTTPDSSTHSKKTTDQGPVPQSLLESIRQGTTLNKTKITPHEKPKTQPKTLSEALQQGILDKFKNTKGTDDNDELDNAADLEEWGED